MRIKNIFDEKDVIEKEGVAVKARLGLWYLTFSGFAVNYIVQMNFSMAIVDMIDTNYKETLSNKTLATSECITDSDLILLTAAGDFDFREKSQSLERLLLDFFGVSCVYISRLTRAVIVNLTGRVRTLRLQVG